MSTTEMMTTEASITAVPTTAVTTAFTHSSHPDSEVISTSPTVRAAVKPPSAMRLSPFT